MKEFLKNNWLLVGLFGVALGIAGNYVTNKITNKQLLDSLISEQAQLLQQSQNAKLSADQQMKLVILQAQINILKK